MISVLLSDVPVLVVGIPGGVALSEDVPLAVPTGAVLPGAPLCAPMIGFVVLISGPSGVSVRTIRRREQ